MVYDFDAVTNRSGTNAYKWEIGAGELPMWVADMDFPTAPVVRAAIERRAAHGVFGYSVIPTAWNAAIVDWRQQRCTEVRDLLYRRRSGYLQHDPQTDDTGREGTGTDTGLQYFFQQYSQ